MTKYRILKLTGIAILTMILLVIISIVEVAIYSMIINTGQAMTVYDTHAEFSAPWVSGIFGFVIFFLVVRYWIKKQHTNILNSTFLYWIIYVTLDLIVILSFGVNWSEILLTFILANSAKLFGGLAAYKLTKTM
ncbi:MAG: hypothetical protein M3Q56_07795 [Bacteroidota bacterium]|nr:hypothetical protein [Bacteroidota bacterium]